MIQRPFRGQLELSHPKWALAEKLESGYDLAFCAAAPFVQLRGKEREKQEGQEARILAVRKQGRPRCWLFLLKAGRPCAPR